MTQYLLVWHTDAKLVNDRLTEMKVTFSVREKVADCCLFDIEIDSCTIQAIYSCGKIVGNNEVISNYHSNH